MQRSQINNLMMAGLLLCLICKAADTPRLWESHRSPITDQCSCWFINFINILPPIFKIIIKQLVFLHSTINFMILPWACVELSEHFSPRYPGYSAWEAELAVLIISANIIYKQLGCLLRMPLAELLLSCQYEGAQAQTNDLLRVLRQRSPLAACMGPGVPNHPRGDVGRTQNEIKQ